MGQVQEFIQYILSIIKIWVIVQPWEEGIRVRRGKTIKRLKGGIYFRIPYIDSVYIQEVRLRISTLPVQTLSTKDLKTITLGGAIGYKIVDVEKLYDTLYLPEATVDNLVMSEVSSYIFNKNCEDINPKKLEEGVLNNLDIEENGIKIEYFKLNNFAVTKTLRLIQDRTWSNTSFKLNVKK